MSWKIIHTKSADHNLEEIRNYISNVLIEPEIARKQIARIIHAISSLDHMPERHRLYEHEPWRSKGLRIFPVDNYLILYALDESQHVVEIARIIYGRRNLAVQLAQSE